MAAKDTSATGVVYLDTSSAQYALDKLNKKITDYDNELKQINVTQGRRITLETQRATAAEKAAAIELQISKGLGNSYNQQKDLVYTLAGELKKLPQNSQAYSDKLKQLQREQGVFDTMKAKINAVEAAQKEMVSGAGAFTKIGLSVGIFFGNIAANLAQNAISGIKSFFSESIDEASAAEKSLSRLKNTLDNLGRSDAIDGITSKADELAKTFSYLDNDDITEVFQQLITYGKLTQKQMNDLLPVIINFAAKSGISINEGASVVIKAMEGNAKALKEYGINIKDGSTVTERFGILMSELGPKVEGAAKAFSETFAGQVATTTQDVANLKEEIGNELLPVMSAFYSSISVTISGLKSIFTNVTAGIYTTIQGLKLSAGIAKDLATLNPQGATNRILQFKTEAEANLKRVETGKELARINESAERQGQQAAAETLDKQEMILKGTKLQKEESLKLYNDLVSAGKQNTEEGKNAARRLYEDVQTIKALEKTIAQTKDKRILGGGDPDSDPEAAAKAEAARKKADEEKKRLFEQYNEFIKGLNSSINEMLTPEASKKFLAIFKQTAGDLEKLQKLAQNDEQYQKGKVLILEEQSIAVKELLAEEAKLYKAAPEQISTVDPSSVSAALRNTLPKQAVKVPLEIVPEIKQEDAAAVTTALGKVIEKLQRNEKAGLQLDIQFGKPKEKRDALLKQLQEEHTLELQNKDLTDNQKLLKEKEYQEKVKKINKAFLTDLFNNIAIGLDFAMQVTGILEKFSQAKTSKENADLARELKGNDVKKAALKKQLDAKLISQQQYNSKTAELDRLAEAKKEELAKKQFERNKKFQLANAAISGAQAVLKTIEIFGVPFPPNFLGIGAMVLTLGTIYAQIRAISAQKFATGGHVKQLENGKITAASNIPTQPNGDDVLATVKVGEVILNKEQQRRLGGDNTFRSIGVPGFATGGRIKPFWEARPYRSLEFTRIAETLKVVRFAEGGRVANQSAGSDPALIQLLESHHEALKEQNESIAAQKAININLVESITFLNNQLRTGIKSTISHKQIIEAGKFEARKAANSEFK